VPAGQGQSAATTDVDSAARAGFYKTAEAQITVSKP